MRNENPTPTDPWATVEVLMERRHAEEVARLTDALTAQRAAMDVLITELQSRVTERDAAERECDRLRTQLETCQALVDAHRQQRLARSPETPGGGFNWKD